MSCAVLRLRAKARSRSGGGRWASGEKAGVSGARALRKELLFMNHTINLLE